MLIKFQEFGRGDEKPYLRCSMDLSFADPTQTYAVTKKDSADGSPFVAIFSSNGKPIMSCIFKDVDHDEFKRATFSTGSDDIASRLVRAFLHAEDLCGAKKTLF